MKRELQACQDGGEDETGPPRSAGRSSGWQVSAHLTIIPNDSGKAGGETSPRHGGPRASRGPFFVGPSVSTVSLCRAENRISVPGFHSHVRFKLSLHCLCLPAQERRWFPRAWALWTWPAGLTAEGPAWLRHPSTPAHPQAPAICRDIGRCSHVLAW